MKPYFVINKPEIIAAQYLKREGKPLPKNSHTRATTIIERAKEWEAPFGTSDQILNELNMLYGV